MKTEYFIQKGFEWLIVSGIRIFIILILMLIALKASQIIAERLTARIEKDKDEEFKKRTDTLSSIIHLVSTIVIFAIAAVMILSELNIKIGPILAAAGIVGVAVGFGAQHLVQDMISGFFILLEDQIRVGDVVEIAGKSGLVEKITLRMVVLRDLAGNVHYIRNGQIDVITNMTKDYSRYVFEIGIAYRENVDEVIEIIQKTDEDLRNDQDFSDDILEPIEILGLDKFADSAIIIKARTKTKPIKQWRVAREFNRRLKKRFDEQNIEIPFPHMTLYIGEDKQGQSPPLNLKIRSESNVDSVTDQ